MVQLRKENQLLHEKVQAQQQWVRFSCGLCIGGGFSELGILTVFVHADCSDGTIHHSHSADHQHTEECMHHKRCTEILGECICTAADFSHTASAGVTAAIQAC